MEQGTRADRVLIIDDDIMSREVLTFLLEDAGLAVDSVPSGEAALEYLQEGSGSPTVVLADVQLPGLSGAALAAALRSACGGATVVIAMSGSQAATETVARFDCFLLKPFEPAELMAAIEGCRAGGGKSGYNKRVKRSHKGGTARSTAQAASAASNPDMTAHSYQGQPGSPVPVTAVSSALDERIYAQLSDTMSSKQLHEMYGLCLRDVRKRIASLRGLAASREEEQFVRQAHAIKGGCGMLGASELYRMAAVLEKSGLKASGLDGRRGANPLDELAAACDRLERILGTRT